MSRPPAPAPTAIASPGFVTVKLDGMITGEYTASPEYSAVMACVPSVSRVVKEAKPATIGTTARDLPLSLNVTVPDTTLGTFNADAKPAVKVISLPSGAELFAPVL